MNSDGVNRDEVHKASDGPKIGHRDALLPGTRLSEFELERVLGEGGFSIVYLAFDHSLERHVAIKEYLPSAYAARSDDNAVAPKSGERKATFETGLHSFIDEARLLAKFEHPALVKVLRFWEANRTAYMAMPYYQGRTLREILRSDPGFATEARLKALISPLLDAVALLHAENCYHRDIAPDNIIVQPNGAPVLLDFGAARRVIGDMTHALTVVLKPGYAPIEQYAEEGGPAQGPWTDVYAFAAVLYAAIIGKAPLAAVARAYNDALVPLQRDPPQGYSLQFLRAIDAALAVRPEDRPQSIEAFRASLGCDGEQDDQRTLLMPRSGALPAQSLPSEPTVLAGITPPPQPAVAAGSTPPPRIHSRSVLLFAGIAAVTLIALGVVLYFALFDGSPDAKPAPIAEGLKVPAPSPVPSVPDPREGVEAALLALDCAHTSFQLDAAGSLTVSGHVQNSGQREELERQLRGIAGVTNLQANLDFVPRPFCEVTSIMAAVRTTEGGALGVRVVKPKLPLRVGQQPVFVEVIGPDFAANVAVDVWSLAETPPARVEVAHLLPHAGYSLSDQFKASERKTINRISDGKTPQVIKVYPPAGRLLFTAVASDRPLVQRDRAFTGDPARYLASLRAEAEAQGSAARIATWYGFVEVLP